MLKSEHRYRRAEAVVPSRSPVDIDYVHRGPKGYGSEMALGKRVRMQAREDGSINYSSGLHMHPIYTSETTAFQCTKSQQRALRAILHQSQFESRRWCVLLLQILTVI